MEEQLGNTEKLRDPECSLGPSSVLVSRDKGWKPPRWYPCKGVEHVGEEAPSRYPRSRPPLWVSQSLCHTAAVITIQGDRKVSVMGTGVRVLCSTASTNGTNGYYIDNE